MLLIFTLFLSISYKSWIVFEKRPWNWLSNNDWILLECSLGGWILFEQAQASQQRLCPKIVERLCSIVCSSVNRLFIKILNKSILVLFKLKIYYHTVQINNNSLNYSLGLHITMLICLGSLFTIIYLSVITMHMVVVVYHCLSFMDLLLYYNIIIIIIFCLLFA